VVIPFHTHHYAVDCLLCFAALDLIEKLIDLDPSKRFTAEQTLAHPYLVHYHDPADEPTFQGPPICNKFPEVYSGSDLQTSRWKGSSTSLIYMLLKFSLVIGMLHAVIYHDIYNIIS